MKTDLKAVKAAIDQIEVGIKVLREQKDVLTEELDEGQEILESLNDGIDDVQSGLQSLGKHL